MALTYVNFFAKYTRRYEAPFGDNHVVMYDLMLERTGYSVLDRIRDLDPSLRNVSCLVLRVRRQSFMEQLQGDDLFHKVLPNVPVAVLAGGIKGESMRLFELPPLRPPTFSLDINELRSAEILAILDRNGAIWGPHDDFHYEIPSGNHTASFIKLGQALQDPVEITRIGDWILPGLDENVGIVGDNGTLLPLLLTIRNEAREIYNWDIPIRVIDSYPSDPAVIQDVANDLYRDLKPDGRILFLISVSGSGRLALEIGRLVLPMRHSLLVICDTSDKPLSEALLHKPIECWPVDNYGKCLTCESKQVLYIDPHSYERVRHIERVSVTMTASAATKHRDFWAAVQRTDAVRLHHDLQSSDGSSRHYGIYIDLLAILSDAWFRKLVLDVLLEREPQTPAITLIPRHASSEAVAALVREAYPKTEILIVPPGELSANIAEKIVQLKSSEIVLVADDGLVSGTTVHNFRPHIHKLFKSKESLPRVRAFVVLARPSRMAQLKDIKNRYYDATGSHFRSGYMILLPDFRDCPWCRERKLIESAQPRLNGDALEISSRRIRDFSGGLPKAFLFGSDEVDTRSRSTGSVFGHLNQTVAFAAATNCIYEQWLHATDDQGDPAYSMKVYYVDVPDLINKFYGDAFAPAVFRTMKSCYLTYSGQNNAIIDQLERLKSPLAFPYIAPELLWAVIEGKLPLRAGSILINEFSDKTPIMNLLKSLLPRAGESDR